MALPLAYGTVNPVYIVDGALVCAGLFAAALGRARVPAWVGLIVLMPAAWTWSASWENQAWQRQQWELARAVIAERAGQPPGRLHLADDAHDGGRFIAWWLLHERGWVQGAEVQPVELCHGLSASEVHAER